MPARLLGHYELEGCEFLPPQICKKKADVVLEPAKLSPISGGVLCYIARCKT